MKNIIHQIKEEIKEEKVVIACSTGSDSMCLLYLLMSAISLSNIIIAYVNHNVREETENEEIYIKKFAHNNNILIDTLKLEKIDSNFEEIARNKRYDFFLKTAHKYHAKYILTAHNADDQLETIIMRILKGSSINGYAGIKEKQNVDDLIIYRPLLKKTKKEIKEYNQINNITYFEDYTNTLDVHLRNRIRKYITPLLLEENPNIYNSINYFSYMLQGVNKLLEIEKVNFIDSYVKNIDDDIIIPLDELMKKDNFIREQILFRILKSYKLSIAQMNELMKVINSEKQKIIYQINSSISCIKEYGNLIITKKDLKLKQFYLEILTPGRYNLNDESYLIVEENICNFITKEINLWYNINKLPIVIRTRKNGDKIVRKSKDKEYLQKVSDVLTNNKIPTIERNNLLLLEENGKIRAILGLKIS